MMSSFNAIVPMACVTAAGIAAMVAEAFRDPGERMPIAGLGVVGLVGAAAATHAIGTIALKDDIMAAAFAPAALPPALKLRRTAVALAEPGRRASP